MQRIEQAELLDAVYIPSPDLDQNLADIARFNRLTRTTAVLVRAVENLIASDSAKSRRDHLVVLDIGTGAGDLPASLLRWAQRRLAIRVLCGDYRGDVLRHASRASQLSSSSGWLQLNAACLPFRDRAVDIAVCAQLAHHLPPDAVCQMFREMRRVSRTGFIVMDLARGRTAQIVIWLLTHLMSSNRLTRHDGPLSAVRAYTIPEIRVLAKEVGLDLTIKRVFPFRWIAVWEA